MRPPVLFRLAGAALAAMLATGVADAGAGTAPAICTPGSVLIVQSPAPTSPPDLKAWPGEASTYAVQATAPARTALDIANGMAVAVGKDDGACYFLAANHVVAGRSVKISTLDGGRQSAAQLIATDQALDAAYLAAPDLGDSCHPVTGFQAYPPAGSTVAVNYFPLSEHVRTEGKIASYDQVAEHGLTIVSNFDVSHGASGTGAFAEDGRLIGLVYAHSVDRAAPGALVTPICRIVTKLHLPQQKAPPYTDDELKRLADLSSTLLDHGEWDKLAVATTGVIQRNPAVAWAYDDRSVAYAHWKISDQAILDAEYAIELDPNDALGYRNLGAGLAGRGDASKADEAYRKSCSLHDKAACDYLADHPLPVIVAVLAKPVERKGEPAVAKTKSIETKPKPKTAIIEREKERYPQKPK